MNKASTSGSGRRTAAAIAGILVAAGVGGFGLTIAIVSALGPKPTDVALASAQTPGATPTIAVTPTPAATPTAAPSPTPTATPTPAPTAPPLPGMLAAIGDSYSQAYNVSPSYLRDHPQFSWVVGTARNDGVTSLLERFRALGGSPAVVDAATSGKKMSDAPRQAQEVVAQAATLPAGKTVYVTFELGTNDLCDDPKTSLSTFTSQLQLAVDTLEVGLPTGSRLLMLPVPDFSHFHAIAQADPATRAALKLTVNSRRCAPFLGSDSPMSLADAQVVLAQYDAALKGACDRLNAATGPNAHLACTYNEALTSDRDFVVADLSTVDHFHPSLSGQAKMAADAWKADVWGSTSR